MGVVFGRREKLSVGLSEACHEGPRHQEPGNSNLRIMLNLVHEAWPSTVKFNRPYGFDWLSQFKSNVRERARIRVLSRLVRCHGSDDSGVGDQAEPTPPGFGHKVLSTSPWARARANFVVADDPEPYFRTPLAQRGIFSAFGATAERVKWVPRGG